MRLTASQHYSQTFFGPPFEYLRGLREQIVKFFKKNSQTGCKTINLASVGLAFPPPSSPTQLPPIEGGDIFSPTFDPPYHKD